MSTRPCNKSNLFIAFLVLNKSDKNISISLQLMPLKSQELKSENFSSRFVFSICDIILQIHVYGLALDRSLPTCDQIVCIDCFIRQKER
jgi:hypothetical protein